MGKVKRKSWSCEEIRSATEVFKDYLNDKNVPSILECVRVIERHTELMGRSPNQLRAWVNNQIKRDKIQGKTNTKGIFYFSSFKYRNVIMK